MKFKEYYITDNNGNSNCVIRSFCKLYNEKYDDVYSQLSIIAKELKMDSFNDIPVFEEYMKRHKTFPIECNKNTKIKDLKLDDSNYIVFCYDKKDFYHMVTIMNKTLYDKNDDSLNLYIISLYKQMN